MHLNLKQWNTKNQTFACTQTDVNNNPAHGTRCRKPRQTLCLDRFLDVTYTSYSNVAQTSIRPDPMDSDRQ